MNIPNLKLISTQVAAGEVREALNTIARFFSEASKSGGIPSANELIKKSVAAAIVNAGSGDYLIPPAPEGLTTTGAFATIILKWNFSNNFTEVWRAEVDDLGQAVMIGSTGALMYVDEPPNNSLSKTYYYWIRGVKSNNYGSIWGPYNQIAGTPGHTADSPSYLLESLLDSKWKASTAKTLGAYGAPSAPNGYGYEVTVAGTTGATEPIWPTTINATVVDGTVTWKCKAAVPLSPPFVMGLVGGVLKTVIKDLFIGDATITNAMIANLAADKITTGYMSGERIDVASSIITGNTAAVNGNMYSVLTGGDINFYDCYGGSFKQYKSLKKSQAGVCTDGQVINIGYFRDTPTVILSPKGLESYNATYSNQNQKFVLEAVNLRKGGDDWLFDAVCQLQLTSNSIIGGTAPTPVLYSDGGYYPYRPASTSLGPCYTTQVNNSVANTRSITVTASITCRNIQPITQDLNGSYYSTISAALEVYYNGAWHTGTLAQAGPFAWPTTVTMQLAASGTADITAFRVVFYCSFSASGTYPNYTYDAVEFSTSGAITASTLTLTSANISLNGQANYMAIG